MSLAVEPKVENFGYYAYSAIQKHFKKTLKWESEVKKDKDPEALHQMRVGMRRLRTATSRFAIAVNLPKVVSDKNIGKIARRLGNLRDLDVLKETLEHLSQPQLPKKERQFLQTALDALEKQREEALADVRDTFKDEHYKAIKQALKKWLDEPNYQPLASLPMQQVLPDLLLPEVSNFLLHPGWLVGTEIEEHQIVVLHNWEAKKIEKELATNSKTLHSLRKQAKRTRYQMELFSDLYSKTYTAYIAELKSIQDILGSIQDSIVLAEWLESILESEIQTQIPTIAALLVENRYQMWQQWQPLQERYLQCKTRQDLHFTVLHPA
ncbi:CHAD domain-containing protein [Fischerella thermalis CCMEE 5282]|jgi:CHAD domain-containing protein|uniref:CHAD domain-containing protein n=1 Tax=Fischerella thermalis TaxID=372787 RepID=UPI0002F843F0|nr:CHAD domain-containing protein [Fischerella thermalis]PMB12378.1 CHAD domain-containing protein [Fischerella thermalis CCMEE 5282]PMB37530.1 CHAD domain-containing protein [Fischerella thermalis CCMEE 5208]